MVNLTSLAALASAPLFINISATLSPSLIRAAMCNGVSSDYRTSKTKQNIAQSRIPLHKLVKCRMECGMSLER